MTLNQILGARFANSFADRRSAEATFLLRLCKLGSCSDSSRNQQTVSRPSCTRLSLRSEPLLIGARSFHDEDRDGVRFRLRPTRANTNKWAIRPHDVPRHDAVGQE